MEHCCTKTVSTSPPAALRQGSRSCLRISRLFAGIVKPQCSVPVRNSPIQVSVVLPRDPDGKFEPHPILHAYIASSSFETSGKSRC